MVVVEELTMIEAVLGLVPSVIKEVCVNGTDGTFDVFLTVDTKGSSVLDEEAGVLVVDAEVVKYWLFVGISVAELVVVGISERCVVIAV